MYNAVSLPNTDLIAEMKNHFVNFWDRDDSVDKVIHAIDDAMERRYSEVAGSQRVADLEAVIEDRISATNFGNELRKNGRDAAHIFFWFHPHPYHSVGHLHMHVLLDLTHSTLAHDSKTLSFAAVEQVLGAEAVPGGFLEYLLSDDPTPPPSICG